MSGGQSCDVSVRDPAGGAENFVLATPPPARGEGGHETPPPACGGGGHETPPPACGEGGHETPPPVLKVVVRLTRSLQDFVLATSRPVVVKMELLILSL